MTPCQHPHNTWAFDAAIELNVGAPYRRAVAACRAACAECPIRAECLRDHREQAGVIAGLTLEERVA
jgi:hypothetical protein